MTSRFLRLGSALLLSVATACTVDLQHELSEQDANDIYVLMERNGISATKLREEGGNEPTYLITVPKSRVADAMRLMRDNALPRPMHKGLKGVADQSSMIPTSTQERAAILNAMGGEVQNALNRIDGVLEARTIVMIPEVNDLTQPDKKPMPSASVLVKYRSLGDGKAPLTETQVKQFVATAVPELRPESITVIMSQSLPPPVEVDGEIGMTEVLGIRMSSASAGTFKVAVAMTGLLVVALAGLAAWTMLRAGGGSARPRRKVAAEE